MATPDNFLNSGISSLGISNNNPGNIRPTTVPWLGQTGTAGNFCQFANVAWGIRAWLVNFFASVNNHGCNTIALYINRYAPPTENNTATYIANMSAATGLDPDEIFPTDQATVSMIMKAQFAIELGANNAAYITDDDIADGYALFNNPTSSFLCAVTISAESYPVAFYGASSLLLIAGGLATWALLKLKNKGKK